MNSPEEIRRYQAQQRAEIQDVLIELARLSAQIATPVILLLILWRIW